MANKTAAHSPTMRELAETYLAYEDGKVETRVYHRLYPDWLGIRACACQLSGRPKFDEQTLEELKGWLLSQHVKSHDELLALRQSDVVGWLRKFLQKPAKQKRRRAVKVQGPRPLTPRQTEVVALVAECKGNIATAAKRLGRDRKTVEESYRVALCKLGKVAVRRGECLFSRDRRGQDDVADIDDARRDDSDEEQRRRFRRRDR